MSTFVNVGEGEFARHRIARKDYICDNFGETIKRGDAYVEWVAGPWCPYSIPGKWTRLRICRSERCRHLEPTVR